MADERDEIRSRIDIADLVGREIPLKHQGRHWKGLCPFHADKNPSFTVSPDTGRYRCWSCQAAGDIFDWVMKRRNVDFAEALQILAKEAGVTLQRGGGLPATTRQTYESAMDVALTFFREQLKHAPVAAEYCERRGLDSSTIERWQLGYAPDIGDALPAHLKRAGISLSEAKTLFLVDEDSRGGFYGKFRRRLMFPIRDEKGALVAFGGRLLGDGQPKYINSSDTPLYRKSRVLYGMHLARDQIAQTRQAVLVEGYLDVIACHRSGVPTAVASLGTALAEDHAKLLKRWCDEVVVLYDSDAAGQKAAGRAVDLLRAEGLRVRVAMMPEGQDPDTLLRSSGAEAVRNSVAAGVTPTEYRIQALEKRLTPERDEFWADVAVILAQESAEIEVVRHLDRLAGLYPGTRDLQLAKGAIRASIARARKAAALSPGAEPLADMAASPSGAARSRARPRPREGPPRATFGEMKSAEIVVLLAFLGEPFRQIGWRLACATELFESGVARRISESTRRAFPDDPPTGRPAEWLPRLEDEEIEGILADLTFDTRGENLNEDYVGDAVRSLERAQRLRRMHQERQAGADLLHTDKSLREVKPDPRVGEGPPRFEI